jgi:nucleoside-diphosphate-sugar epimerase
MRIFVTGATGVIGRRVLPLLLGQGHSVTAAVRNRAGRERLSHPRVTFAEADLFDVDALKRALQGHQALINLATHMPDSAFKMLFRGAWRANDRIRSEGVRNLVDAALATGVERMIQESFAPTYPDRGAEWISETTPLAPAAYNKTVLDAEASVGRFASSQRTGVILRFAAFYGPDAMQVRSYIASVKAGWAPMPGRRSDYISSVSHDDAASAVVAALKVKSGPYNVSDDEPLRRGEFFGRLAAELKLKPPRFLPKWTAPMFGAVGGTMARSLRVSNRKLREETGWTPRYPSVREGWPAMLREMEAQGSVEMAGATSAGPSQRRSSP